jgi:hypothetical protein
MARVEFQNDNSRLLNTQENRKAFVAKYKDRLYGLALNLTQDSRQSCNLVVAAFQHAFEKYTTRPCPEDCFPFLSSSIYLLFASGNETEVFAPAARPGFHCFLRIRRPSGPGNRTTGAGGSICASGRRRKPARAGVSDVPA